MNRSILLVLGVLHFAALMLQAEDSVFVRLKIAVDDDVSWHVKVGGYIHSVPWYLKAAVLPEGADKDEKLNLHGAQWTSWFDLKKHNDKLLHGRLHRAGGIAEFPNVTADFTGKTLPADLAVTIELAAAPDEAAVVKRWQETIRGTLTSFIVSPNLRADVASLESAGEMSARRLKWAREASGGKRVSPELLIVQTSFWGPQRTELNLQEAEVLWLLGFNNVGGADQATKAKFPFRESGGHGSIDFAPALTREECAKQIEKAAKSISKETHETLFNFSDEISCHARIGTNPVAVANFHAWLKEHGVRPQDLAAATLDEVQPIETPTVLRERHQNEGAAANRIFYYTTRFRQESATQRLKWLGEEFRKIAPQNVRSSTLLADHPYFGGSGLGMGMQMENTTWGGYPLSLDWFSLARERVVDVLGVEDWMGLQYMYGPGFTWEGFQLMGFQAAMIRSGSRGTLPIIAWITPSDATNLRLKSASALCQGAKHFFYWTYGPTATGTENYWSDLRGAYDGIATVTRHLAGAEHILADGKTRPTRVAVLYSLSSDLWQPFGYVSMLERRLTYLSLVHEQYLVDFLTERDVEEGRLRDYAVLYAVDPNVSTAASRGIRDWVKEGGKLYAAGAALSRDEFNAPSSILAETFGIEGDVSVIAQQGRFDLRAALNDLPWLDDVKLDAGGGFGALGVTVQAKPAAAQVIGRFNSGAPAVLRNKSGKGEVLWVATCPGASYAKDARFAFDALKEKWPAGQRAFINQIAHDPAVVPLVELSHPVVETGVFDAEIGTALVLANFTYEDIPELKVTLPLRRKSQRVRSMAMGELKFEARPATDAMKRAGYDWCVGCSLRLGLSDILVFE